MQAPHCTQAAPAGVVLDGHQLADLHAIFAECFAARYNTVLVRGAAEPVYLPATASQAQHHIVYAHGFYASALHEIAHWCIAGPQRREQEDYGYWYCPDGRNAEQQAAFEQVEVKPQALEWLFSRAAGLGFRVSVDNLSGEACDPMPFRRAVHAQVQRYWQQGFPQRAGLFIEALLNFYQTRAPFQPQAFRIEDL